EALDTQAESEAGVAFRVDATIFQHLRVHHAATQHFQPALAAIGSVPADVDLGRRLGEGKEAGPKTHVEITLEERAHEGGQRAFQVGEAGSFVDQQALDLMEHGRVRLVRIAAVDLARGDNADWRLASIHGTYLHRRGVRAQQA